MASSSPDQESSQARRHPARKSASTRPNYKVAEVFTQIVGNSLLSSPTRPSPVKAFKSNNLVDALSSPSSSVPDSKQSKTAVLPIRDAREEARDDDGNEESPKPAYRVPKRTSATIPDEDSSSNSDTGPSERTKQIVGLLGFKDTSPFAAFERKHGAAKSPAADVVVSDKAVASVVKDVANKKMEEVLEARKMVDEQSAKIVRENVEASLTKRKRHILEAAAAKRQKVDDEAETLIRAAENKAKLLITQNDQDNKAALESFKSSFQG